MACLIKEVYHLGYRQPQGFLQSLIASREWKVNVPDYSVINRRKEYEQLKKRKIKDVIPPRKNARIKKHENNKDSELARDKSIRAIRKLDCKGWKKKGGCHSRSKAESTIFRLKSQFGERL